MMKVRMHTDNVVKLDGELMARIEADAMVALERFERRLTEVDLHVSAQRGGGHRVYRCRAEACAAGREPVAVSATEPSAAAAIEVALEKLASRVAHDLDRMAEVRPRHPAHSD